MKKLLHYLLNVLNFLSEYKIEIIMVLTFVPLLALFCYMAFTISISFGFLFTGGLILFSIFCFSEKIALFLKNRGVE